MNYIKINGDQKIVVYTDASCGTLKNSGSQGAYLIFLMGENNFYNLLSWQLKQLKSVAGSSLTADAIALLDGVETSLYIKELFKELCKIDLSVEVYTENQSLVHALKSSKDVNEKCLRINITALKEYISTNAINNSKWIKLSDQLADILTKQSTNLLPLINALNDGFICYMNIGQGLEASLCL